MTQLAFDGLLQESHGARLAACAVYARRYRRLYLAFARRIEPNLDDWSAVWDRIAFAILTANAETRRAHDALRLLRTARDARWVVSLPGITPERVDYVNALPRREQVLRLLKRSTETFPTYRCRLSDDVPGLSLTKASYASCLLYPFASTVVCLDVWMQRLLIFGAREFRSLSLEEYRAHERSVCVFAAHHEVPPAVGQWIMWDFIRTGFPTPQNFFR